VSALHNEVKLCLDSIQGPAAHPGPQVPKSVIYPLDDTVIKGIHNMNECLSGPINGSAVQTRGCPPASLG
jgi:hypothetical protein